MMYIARCQYCNRIHGMCIEDETTSEKWLSRMTNRGYIIERVSQSTPIIYTLCDRKLADENFVRQSTYTW